MTQSYSNPTGAAKVLDVNDEGSITAGSLIGDLRRLGGVACAGCGEAVNSHHALMSVAIGFKNAPRCLFCLARRLNEDQEQLSDSLINYIRQRQCYFEAWNWANRQAGLPENKMTSRERNNSESGGKERTFELADSWDAGEQGCGELALELRTRLEKLKPGQVFRLTARDLGVPEDMPAWCRLTGHTLLRAAHPDYWIRRKG